MLSKKRVGFVLFSTIFLILLMPHVFALLEDLYFAVYSGSDLVMIYQQWSSWIDFIFIFLIISSAARAGLGKMYKEGNEENPALKGLYIGLGLFGAISLVVYSRITGYWAGGLVLAFAPFWMIILILISIIWAYRFIKSDDEKNVWTLGNIILIMLLAMVIGLLAFREIFEPILNTILGNPLFIAILFFLILWALLSFVKIHKRDPSSESNSSSSRSRGSDGEHPEQRQREAAIAEEKKKSKNFSLKIKIYPDLKVYTVGQEITLEAVTTRFFSEYSGNFEYDWQIAGREHEKHSKTISLKIEKDLTPYPRQKVQIVVLVKDKNDNKNKEIATKEIIIEQSASGPEEVNPKTKKDFKDKGKKEETLPENLGFSVDFLTLGKDPQTFVKDDNFNLEINQRCNFKPKFDSRNYTIKVDIKKNRKDIGEYYLNRSWGFINPKVDGRKEIIFVLKRKNKWYQKNTEESTIKITVNVVDPNSSSRRSEPPDKPLGKTRGGNKDDENKDLENPKLILEIIDSNGPKEFTKDDDFETNLDEKITFNAKIQDADPANYTIEIKDVLKDKEDIFNSSKGYYSALLIPKTTNNKEILCILKRKKKGLSKLTFWKKNKSDSIQITIKVLGSTPKERRAPPNKRDPKDNGSDEAPKPDNSEGELIIEFESSGHPKKEFTTDGNYNLKVNEICYIKPIFNRENYSLKIGKNFDDDNDKFSEDEISYRFIPKVAGDKEIFFKLVKKESWYKKLALWKNKIVKTISIKINVSDDETSDDSGIIKILKITPNKIPQDAGLITLIFEGKNLDMIKELEFLNKSRLKGKIIGRDKELLEVDINTLKDEDGNDRIAKLGKYSLDVRSDIGNIMLHEMLEILPPGTTPPKDDDEAPKPTKNIEDEFKIEIKDWQSNPIGVFDSNGGEFSTKLNQEYDIFIIPENYNKKEYKITAELKDIKEGDRFSFLEKRIVFSPRNFGKAKYKTLVFKLEKIRKLKNKTLKVIKIKVNLDEKKETKDGKPIVPKDNKADEAQTKTGPEFKLKVDIVKNNFAGREELGEFDNDKELHLEEGKSNVFLFTPIVKGANISDYKVEITKPSKDKSDEFYENDGGGWTLVQKSPKTKVITCTFKENKFFGKELGKITITLTGDDTPKPSDEVPNFKIQVFQGKDTIGIFEKSDTIEIELGKNYGFKLNFPKNSNIKSYSGDLKKKNISKPDEFLDSYIKNQAVVLTPKNNTGFKELEFIIFKGSMPIFRKEIKNIKLTLKIKESKGTEPPKQDKEFKIKVSREGTEFKEFKDDGDLLIILDSNYQFKPIYLIEEDEEIKIKTKNIKDQVEIIIDSNTCNLTPKIAGEKEITYILKKRGIFGQVIKKINIKLSVKKLQETKSPKDNEVENFGIKVLEDGNELKEFKNNSEIIIIKDKKYNFLPIPKINTGKYKIGVEYKNIQDDDFKIINSNEFNVDGVDLIPKVETDKEITYIFLEINKGYGFNKEVKRITLKLLMKDQNKPWTEITVTDDKNKILLKSKDQFIDLPEPILVNQKIKIIANASYGYLVRNDSVIGNKGLTRLTNSNNYEYISSTPGKKDLEFKFYGTKLGNVDGTKLPEKYVILSINVIESNNNPKIEVQDESTGNVLQIATDKEYELNNIKVGQEISFIPKYSGNYRYFRIKTKTNIYKEDLIVEKQNYSNGSEGPINYTFNIPGEKVINFKITGAPTDKEVIITAKINVIDDKKAQFRINIIKSEKGKKIPKLSTKDSTKLEIEEGDTYLFEAIEDNGKIEDYNVEIISTNKKFKFAKKQHTGVGIFKTLFKHKVICKFEKKKGKEKIPQIVIDINVIPKGSKDPKIFVQDAGGTIIQEPTNENFTLKEKIKVGDIIAFLPFNNQDYPGFGIVDTYPYLGISKSEGLEQVGFPNSREILFTPKTPGKQKLQFRFSGLPAPGEVGLKSKSIDVTIEVIEEDNNFTIKVFDKARLLLAAPSSNDINIKQKIKVGETIYIAPDFSEGLSISQLNPLVSGDNLGKHNPADTEFEFTSNTPGKKSLRFICYKKGVSNEGPKAININFEVIEEDNPKIIVLDKVGNRIHDPTDENFELKLKLNQEIYFVPIFTKELVKLENGLTGSRTLAGDIIKKDRENSIKFQANSKGKRIINLLFYDKSNKLRFEIKANIEVEENQEIKITSPITREVSEKNPLEINLNDSIKLEVNSNGKVMWFYSVGYSRDKNRKNYMLGLGKRLDFNIKERFLEGSHTIFAELQDEDGEKLAEDYIWIKVVDNNKKLKIISPTTREISKSVPLILKLGENFTLEAESKLDYPVWSISEGHIEKPPINIDAIRIFGNGKKIEVSNTKKNFTQGEYTIFAEVQDKDEKVLAQDHIWINLIEGEEDPEIKITKVDGKEVSLLSFERGTYTKPLNSTIKLEAEINSKKHNLIWVLEKPDKEKEFLGEGKKIDATFATTYYEPGNYKIAIFAEKNNKKVMTLDNKQVLLDVINLTLTMPNKFKEEIKNITRTINLEKSNILALREEINKKTIDKKKIDKILLNISELEKKIVYVNGTRILKSGLIKELLDKIQSVPDSNTKQLILQAIEIIKTSINPWITSIKTSLDNPTPTNVKHIKHIIDNILLEERIGIITKRIELLDQIN